MKPLVAALCAGLPIVTAGEPVSTDSLMREMATAQRLAEWPELSYRTLQASSYDRASKTPGQPGWFANADWSHFIREERDSGRTEHVMMEDGGPSI